VSHWYPTKSQKFRKACHYQELLLLTPSTDTTSTTTKDEEKDEEEDDENHTTDCITNTMNETFVISPHDLVWEDDATSSPAQLSPKERLEAHVQQLREEYKDDEVNEGVSCIGEPSVDPSRFMRPHAGDSEWVEDW
jgi:hypothetical protein